MEHTYLSLLHRCGPKKIFFIALSGLLGALVSAGSAFLIYPDEPMTEEEIDYDIELEKLRGRKR